MRRILILCSVTLVCLADARHAMSQQGQSVDCLQDRVKCAYADPLDRLAKAYSEPAAATVEERRKQEDRREDLISAVVNPVAEPDIFVLALSSFSGALRNGAVSDWQRARVDKQIGTTSASKGSTDLASRPSTSELLGLGVQLGALTETVSGSVVTFQANAEGAYRAIVGRPVICQDCLAPWSLNNLNVYLSFDLNAQSTKTLGTSGAATNAFQAPSTIVLPQSSKQFSSLDVKYNLKNPIDPRSATFQNAWKAAYNGHVADLKAEAKILDSSLAAILTPLIKDERILKLESDYQSDLKKAAAAAKTGDDLYPTVQKYFSQLEAFARQDVPDLDKQVAAAVASYARYSQLNYDAVSQASGSQLTAEYTYNHPKIQPDTHDFRLIYSLTPKHGKGTPGALFTLNLAGSAYGGRIPAGAKYGRVRDCQFAAQLDRPLGDVITHPATLTLAGYVQYQFDPSVLNVGPGNLVPGTNIMLPKDAQVLLGTKGTLGIVQAKVTINTKSGVNIPIGVSWANKTDLLNATDVRGHIGITYDFDSIGQLFGRQ